MLYLPARPYREIQQPDLCPAAAIATECNRRDISFGRTLEELAVKLDIHINEKNKGFYSPALGKNALPDGDARIGLLFETYKDPEFRKRLKLEFGLEATPYHLSEITGITERKYNAQEAIASITEFIRDNFSRGNGLILNYRLEPFTGREDGHYVTAFAFDEKGKKEITGVDENDKEIEETVHEIYVCDTSPFSPQYWKTDVRKFINGMQPIWNEDDGKIRERGIIVISGPNNRVPEEKREMIKFLRTVPEYQAVNARVRIYPSHPVDRTRPYSPTSQNGKRA